MLCVLHASPPPMGSEGRCYSLLLRLGLLAIDAPRGAARLPSIVKIGCSIVCDLPCILPWVPLPLPPWVVHVVNLVPEYCATSRDLWIPQLTK